MKTCLVFGGNGAIGTAIADLYRSLEFSVWTSSRTDVDSKKQVIQVTGDVVVDAPILTSCQYLT